ncbi:TPA: toll/interleukin-1 receptor domain-containing protein [Klebsiella quasipneumoniae subsp. quasipneumoniae]|nr:toll/interleukin-1 receptor domain-containing protein [Klebsiella quasipneumoniae subsp. quasipneumoniae]
MQVFLSHNSEDKPIVEKIGEFLEANGVTAWIDKWRMSPGDSLIEKIGEALDKSEKLVVFLSPDSVDSNWVKQEVATGKIMELAEEKGVGINFIIPVLLRPCKIPWFLKDKVYANFSDKSFEAACHELLRGINDTPLGNQESKFSNETVRIYEPIKESDGNYKTIIEFGVKISPTQHCKTGVKLRNTNEIKWMHWSNTPGTPEIPFMSKFGQIEYTRGDNFYMIGFQSPRITSSQSVYIAAITDSPITEPDIEAIIFSPTY